jgi:hypothetical protein
LSSGARRIGDVIPSSGGWDKPGPLIVLAVALLALLGVVREFVRVVR